MKQYQSEAINELAAALAKAQSEMTHAAKAVSNTFFKSKYADLPAVIDAARPYLTKNGLSVLQITDSDEAGNIVLITQLTHSSGQWVRSWYPVKPVKNDPQGLGSATTYARRYAYCAITGVAAMDEDDDGNEASGHTHEPPKYKGVFESQQLLDMFVGNSIDALAKAETLDKLKDVKTSNLARWGAMKDSGNQLDRDGYAKIIAKQNEMVVKLKPATVESAARDA